jgi:hypothetical protein
MFGHEEIFYVVVFLVLAYLVRWLYTRRGDDEKK